MFKTLTLRILPVILLSGIVPIQAQALTIAEIMPQAQADISAEAKAYIVVDRQSGQVLLAKNPSLAWPPASLTKLLTVLVFMESKTSLNKTITMKKEDEVGGQRLVTKSGIQYKARDLLHAALIASDNNAAHALARSTGLSEKDFVDLMNKKVKALGALNTGFYETTGMNPSNYTTASDFAKILNAALSDPYISLVVKKSSYSFASVNNKRYRHTVTTTNQILDDQDMNVIGGKTGFLEESQYNFASIIKDKLGNEFIVVVLGAPNPKEQFGQTKTLAYEATALKVFGYSPAAVLGTSTASSTFININY